MSKLKLLGNQHDTMGTIRRNDHNSAGALATPRIIRNLLAEDSPNPSVEANLEPEYSVSMKRSMKMQSVGHTQGQEDSLKGWACLLGCTGRDRGLGEQHIDITEKPAI